MAASAPRTEQEVMNMPKYKLSARSVAVLEQIVEVENEDVAWDVLERDLAFDMMGQVDGWIENEKVELIEE